ncbi:hypothetical protein V6N13_062148 [Hibiscus sabdariffa]
MPFPSIADGCSTISNGCGLLEQERDGRIAALIPLCQNFLAALIPEEDSQFDIYGTGFQMDGELGSNGLTHIVNFQSTGHASVNVTASSATSSRDSPERWANSLGSNFVLMHER